MVRGTDARAHRESKLRRVLHRVTASNEALACLLYTSDAADE